MPESEKLEALKTLLTKVTQCQAGAHMIEQHEVGIALKKCVTALEKAVLQAAKSRYYAQYLQRKTGV